MTRELSSFYSFEIRISGKIEQTLCCRNYLTDARLILSWIVSTDRVC